MSGRKGKTTKRKSVDVAKENAPSELCLGNSKQTDEVNKINETNENNVVKRKKGRKENVKKKGESSKVKENSKIEAETTAHIARISFEENNELVDMEVGHNSFLSEEEAERDQGNEKGDEEDTVASESEAEEEETNEQSANNNAGSSGISKEDEEDFNPDEMWTMMKFAKFLEMQGFLKQPSGQETNNTKDTKAGKDQLRDGKLGKTKRKSKNNEIEKVVGKENSPESVISEETIYERVVPLTRETGEIVVDPEIIFNPRIPNNQTNNLERSIEPKRVSTSSEDEPLNSSDEINQHVYAEISNDSATNEHILFKQFLDYRRKSSGANRRDEEPIPSSSWNAAENDLSLPPPMLSAEEKARKMIKQAEKAKVRIYEVPGKDNSNNLVNN